VNSLRFTILIMAIFLASCRAPAPTDEERYQALERDAQASCACETRTHGPARAQCWRAFDAKISALTPLGASKNALVPTSPVFQCLNDKGPCIGKWYSVDIARSPQMRVCSAADAKAIDHAFERVLDKNNDVPAAIAAGLAVARRAPTLIVDDIPPAGAPGQ
jgi:hypothetical protein